MVNTGVTYVTCQSMIISMVIIVGKTRPPPMTWNATHTTYKNGDDCWMVYEIVLPTLHQMTHMNPHDIFAIIYSRDFEANR